MKERTTGATGAFFAFAFADAKTVLLDISMMYNLRVKEVANFYIKIYNFYRK